MSPEPEISLSIVSHGQGALVRDLLEDIRHGVDATCEVLVTLNIPEDEAFLHVYDDLNLVIIRNSTRKGFGANHNAAFARSRGRCFAVVNPDIRARPLRVQPLLQTLSEPGVGAVGPSVYAPDGRLEDNARRFPTPSRLIQRRLGCRRTPDYEPQQHIHDVDWLAGMFVVFPREVFARVGGFDERYFMYLEDTDICRRLQRLGLRTVLQPTSRVVHDAQRASRSSLRHLLWHIRSAWRFLTSDSHEPAAHRKD